jgi:S-adenosylmethionine/arginine decarboxylase-like enzyme
MDTRSQHLLFDAVCEQPLSAADVEHIKNVIETNLTVINKIEHKFTPQGETIVFILSESHFTLHTYPENNFISMDVYVCNLDINLNKIVDQIAKKIPFSKVDQRVLSRGNIGSPSATQELSFIYLITVIVACASILYEFLLAQSLSTTMGNTALRYNLTIGLYIASMGLGALLYNKLLSKELFKEFVKVELILSFFGAIAPILVLINDYVFNHLANSTNVHFFSNVIQVPLFTANHALIVIIGFLSGLELPLLIDMGKSLDKKKGNHVLAYDYLGTLLGAILFPIIIVPSLHIFTIGYIVSALNVMVGLTVLIKMKVKSRMLTILSIVMFILWTIFILNADSLNQWLVQRFYFGN